MSALRAAGRWLVALLVLGLGRLPGSEREPGRPRILPEHPPERSAENATLVLLLISAGLAVCFVVAYALDWSTQLLGLSIGLALAFLGAAAAVASRRLVPQEERAEELDWATHEEEQERAEQIVEEGTTGISRRRLLGLAAGGATATVGAALVVPALSLGPALDTGRLRASPWRAGRRLVDEEGRPIALTGLALGTYVAGFPEGAAPDEQGSPLAVVRVRPDELEPPPGREGWDADGVLAYSSICTHAACAVTLFRYPTYEPTSPGPALVCPCHYSTFDVRKGCEVVFGPAGRPLPQLPLDVDGDGNLVAAGELSGPPGPSWWGVRL